jgi:7-cyano-7-deazaguanine synthase
MNKAFVLLSGGIDSTTVLYSVERSKAWEYIEGVSVFYGQRHVKEIEYALRSCNALGVSHRVLDIASIMPNSMLTDRRVDIPNMSYSEIKGVSPTYVPFRNGLLLSMVAARAQKWVNDEQVGVAPAEAGIFFGAHAEDAQNWAYPDCTPEFIGAMANAIYVGTYHAVRLHAPLEELGKAEIVTMGDRLGVDWKNTWSCYAGGETHCGVCPTCRARRDGFEKAGVKDPTEYAQVRSSVVA